MAVSPEVAFEDIQDDEELIETSRTYKIDFESKRITGETINGLAAIEQFVHLAIRTQRYAYPIFSHDVGSELEELIADEGATAAYKEMEIPRLIEEAIIYDERILAVTDFEIEHVSDAFHIRFTVETDEGALEVEEVIGADV